MLQTQHSVLIGNANNLGEIASNSVDLVLTSPPYPMIEMWDETFGNQNPKAREALANGNGNEAFEEMHLVLDRVWEEIYRVLKPGSFACINIGDATRSIDGQFSLYPNHSRITSFCTSIGLTNLPAIIWRKQTNAPNKFMGSGMLPAGAYVTLEHEYVLIFRKGGKRAFPNETKNARSRSAFFWEERNNWFSDVWFDLKGASQNLIQKEVRNRSGSFPFELAYRLISMYSAQEDLVLDPFLGTGTTTFASIIAARNSMGVEIEEALLDLISSGIGNHLQEFGNAYIMERLARHIEFVNKRKENAYEFKYNNVNYDFPVMTRQELELALPFIESIQKSSAKSYSVDYQEKPELEYFGLGWNTSGTE